MKKHIQLTLPIAVILASIIVGGFLLTAQIIKTVSIEKDHKIQQNIQQEKQDSLDACIDSANAKGERAFALALKSLKAGKVFNATSTIAALDMKQKIIDDAKSECYKRYPVN